MVAKNFTYPEVGFALPLMADEEEKEDGAIYKVDTVPPPPGEDDAYSAPTRVGEMPPEVLEAMRGAGLVPGKDASTSKVPSALRPPRPPSFEIAADAVSTPAANDKALDAPPAPSSAKVKAVAPSPLKVPSTPPTGETDPSSDDVPARPSPLPDLSQLQREDHEAAQELGDSSIEEIERPYARDDDADDAPTQMHPSAKPLPPALGAGSIPGARPPIPREALLVLALVVALITLALALGMK